jgi:hypothetical protein
MNEAQWLASEDHQKMLKHPGAKLSDRKFRLFVCAWCRLCGLAAGEARAAVEASERYADGEAREELLAAREGVRGTPASRAAYEAAGEARRTVASAVWWLRADPFSRENGPAIAGALRDVAGNPFRPVAFDPAWRTPTAVTIAARMYDSRNFAAMSVLADSLQDIGCEVPAIIDHCRQPAPHVRGCWVVDLVLGKE